MHTYTHTALSCNDNGVLVQCVQVLPDIYAGGQVIYAASDAPVVYDSDQFMPNAPRMLHRGYTHMPVLDVHPYFTECLDAHQIVVRHSKSSFSGHY